MMNAHFRYTYVILFLLLTCNSCHKPADADEDKPIKGAAMFEDPPEWSGQVIWYQIFVERFRNGDPGNDPTAEDIIGSYPGFVPASWAITPWTQDWYKDDAYFAELEGTSDTNGNPVNNFNQKLQLRRYGGDLQGVLDKIDYMDSLGISAIYFNPLNDAPSLHKYDARYWRHIDRNFGPDPKKDIATMAGEDPLNPETWQWTEADNQFLQLVKEFHSRDIKVILDYSWNHTGTKFWAWEDLVQNQQNSKYTDWYWVEQFDDPETPENEFKYKGWLGVPDLPEIKETEKQDHTQGVRAFEGDVYSQEVKDLIFNVTRRWLDPNNDGDPSDGVDGYRLDVAAEMPLGFWREFRKVVREANPDAYLVGEVWWEEYPDKLLDPEPYLKGDVFDAPMNYRWYRAARHFFNQSPDKIGATEFVDSLNSFRSNLRDQNNYAMMNLTASHDAPRVLTSLFNKNKYKYGSNPAKDNDYKIHKPDAETYQTLKLLLAQQFTYIGSPHIWAGDEMGMWGSDDPSCRKPLIWPDLDFDDESAHPFGKDRPVDQVEFDNKLFQYYQKLIAIRRSNMVLVDGKIDFVIIDDKNDVLAYSRYDDTSEVIVVFNTSTEAKEIQVPTKFDKEYNDELSWEFRQVAENKQLTITLAPRTSAVLVGK